MPYVLRHDLSKWADYLNSDPVKEIRESGVKHLVLTKREFLVLRQHPKVVDYFKFLTPRLPYATDLAAVFGVESLQILSD